VTVSSMHKGRTRGSYVVSALCIVQMTELQVIMDRKSLNRMFHDRN
jgi:hypothetical protein